MKRHILVAALFVAAFAFVASPAWADVWSSDGGNGWRVFVSWDAFFDWINNLGLPWSG